MLKSKKFKFNKFHYILLAIVLILATIIRIWGLGDKSLWIDEIYSYLFISQKTFLQSYNYMFTDLSPPIYYLMLYSFAKLFGSSEFILRLPSFIAGVASVVVIYFLTKKNFNKQIALGATISTGLSPVMLYYSQEARPYSLFALFSIITVSIWIEIINKINSEEIDSKTLLKYTVFSLLTILTHYWGLVLIFFQILYLFIFAQIKKRKIKNLLFTSAKIFLIAGYFFFCQYYLKAFSSILFNPEIPRVNINNLNPFKQIFYENYVFLLIIIVFLLLNAKKIKSFVINEFTEKKLASPLIYLTYIIILPICVYLILDKNCSYLHPRHLIFTVPVAYILISFIVFSFSQSKKIIKNIFIFGVSLAFLGIYLFVPQKIENRVFTYYNKPKQEWGESTKYITDNADKNSLILIYGLESYYDYYFEKYNKNTKKLNIIPVLDEDFFNKDTISQKIKYFRKKYRKIYFYSIAILDIRVSKVKKSMETAKSACSHLKHKNFVNINLYECE